MSQNIKLTNRCAADIVKSAGKGVTAALFCAPLYPMRKNTQNDLYS